MSKKIVIDNCSQCPYADHKGPFGLVAYVPVCIKVHPHRILPHTEITIKHHIHAKPADIIPNWCPLENN